MIGGVLNMGRSMMKARMTDECRITRAVEAEWNEEAGKTIPSMTLLVYDGICEVKAPTVSGKQVETGSQLVVVSQTEVRLPHDASGVMPGDLVTVTKSRYRPHLVGREYIIAAPFDGSLTTALRYRVEVDDER